MLAGVLGLVACSCLASVGFVHRGCRFTWFSAALHAANSFYSDPIYLSGGREAGPEQKNSFFCKGKVGAGKTILLISTKKSAKKSLAIG